VVKELVENSIDAGATEIHVVIEKGGHQLIQVRDDGSGIPAEELPRAFRRYHTSKLASVEDLFRIESLGFRGEALASITAVAKVELVSGVKGAATCALSIEEGASSPPRPAPELNGTQLTVRDLFYNTPARRKFLKAPQTEFRQIVKTLRRFALAYPEIAFHLVHNEREILALEPTSLRERIVTLLDPTYAEHLLPVQHSKGDFSITGFVGNLNLVRTRPGEQFIFLNRRYIQDRLLNSAVYAAYQSLVKRGEYPFFVLNLVLPTDQVDVNVHPMKLEVRFRDEWRVYQVLKSAIGEVLEALWETLPSWQRVGARGNRPFTHLAPEQETGQAALGLKTQPPGQKAPELERARQYVSSLASRDDAPELVDPELIWQVHNKYILSQISSGLVIIDQHVAHERVLFEEALNAFHTTPLGAQTLLFPQVLEFSPVDYSALLDMVPFLEKIGFRMKTFGSHTILLEAVPSQMGWGNEKKILTAILDSYLKEGKQYSSLEEGLAASYACHAAIKAGDALTKAEMQALVNRLFGTKHPYYCPHGRPIIVQLSLEELDRRFERS
jgi:DNA mismatch repair protein MutL